MRCNNCSYYRPIRRGDDDDYDCQYGFKCPYDEPLEYEEEIEEESGDEEE